MKLATHHHLIRCTRWRRLERLLISTGSILSYIYPLDYEYVMGGYIVNRLVVLILQYEVTWRNCMS
jgi:hypothetical protein